VTPPIENILVVDDHEKNRQLAEAQLVTAGYSVTLAEDGGRALERFGQRVPDLVLLDVMMPKLDGFQTCQRMRALRGGADVPIVFITALSDLASYEQALASGADDFLTKPVNRTELLMRVRSLLRIKRLNDELKKGSDVIRSQRDALVVAQGQKEELMALVVHDLKNPLTPMLGNVQFLERTPQLGPDQREALRDIGQAAVSMHRMVLNLLDISKSEDGTLAPRLAPLEVGALFEELRSTFGRSAAARNVTIEAAGPLEKIVMQADADLFRRLLENLLDNAIRHSPSGGTVRLEGVVEGGRTELGVRDQGPGVPEEHRARVFEKYFQIDRGAASVATRAGRGLGLAFCRLAAEAHGGRIWVEESPPRGSVFRVSLPLGR